MLTPILLAAAMLDAHTTDPETRRLTALMRDDAERGASLLRQILTFASGSAHPTVPSTAQQLLDTLRRVVAATFPRSFEIEVDIARDVDTLHVDPATLFPALVDRCLAARQAMPAGGVLTLRAERAGDDVVISVMPAGAAAADYPGVFVSTKTTPAISRDLPAPARGRGELILVAGGETAVHTRTVETLRAHGYQAITASTTPGAVAAIARDADRVAAVLTDDAHTVRALAALKPALPVVALDDRLGADLAVAAVVARPFHPEQLLRALAGVLAH